MADWAKLIEAVAGLVGAVAWPAAFAVAVWLVMRRHKDAVARLIDRLEQIMLPGGLEIHLKVAEQQARDDIQSLVERAATELDPHARKQAAEELAERAEELGALGILSRGPWVEAEPDIRTERQWAKFAEWVEAARRKRRPSEPPKDAPD
ncbi:hypothetical protein ITP53_46695 [Nonomuraea sp. K274]|uniref:Uncharacterized protein n=1 Tax=Nonomuraea cypriaca TaxID=1187855 RepID=A0A931F6D7_9ACTN|nr:hypothetical protein [Nonomuraea cypriaca]MBF8193041.1 hypothetical protein [Nonomuraea cypriaca]